MPKDGYRKLGNLKLDNKNPNLAIPPAQNEEEENETPILEFVAKLEIMRELMDHFEIDPGHKNAWFLLAFSLADHYVPAMQPRKSSGRSKSWDGYANVNFYLLVEKLKATHPKLKRKEIFNLVPREAQKTVLRKIIKPDTNPTTLETRYDKLNSTKEFKNLKASISELLSLEKFIRDFSERLYE